MKTSRLIVMLAGAVVLGAAALGWHRARSVVVTVENRSGQALSHLSVGAGPNDVRRGNRVVLGTLADGAARTVWLPNNWEGSVHLSCRSARGKRIEAANGYVTHGMPSWSRYTIGRGDTVTYAEGTWP